MRRSRANEIPDLVKRLASRSPRRVDAARARLAIVGPRAVEELIGALEGDDNRVRARVMPLLALIQDPRGREPLIATLIDRRARIRGIAARSLARFPSIDVVAALERLLERERNAGVQVAAVRSLVEQCAAGLDDAIPPVLERLVDTGQPTPIRVAALALVRVLPAAQGQSIVSRLMADPDRRLRNRADALGWDSERGITDRELRRRIADLAADDYGKWYEAVNRLTDCGGAVVRPLLCAMREHAHDPEFCARTGMVLKSLGPRRCRALVEGLERIEEPLPLQVLVEVVGALGEKSLIYRLKGLIEKIVARGATSGDPSEFDPLQRVRAKAHLELARIGSRVAIRDLREAMQDPKRRIELELIDALAMTGKREEIPLLLRAYGREEPYLRRRIAGVVQSIMRRERIRRNDRMFSSLAEGQRRALGRILPRAPRPRRAAESRQPG